jgi:hypothetical protein
MIAPQPTMQYVKYTTSVQQPNLAGESQGIVLSPLVVNKIYTNDNPINVVKRPMKTNPHERTRMDTVSHRKDLKKDFYSTNQSLNDYFKMKYGF